MGIIGVKLFKLIGWISQYTLHYQNQSVYKVTRLISQTLKKPKGFTRLL